MDSSGKDEQSIRDTLASSQQARYQGRPEVKQSDINEIFICDGHGNEILKGKLYLGDFLSASEPMKTELQSLNVTGIINCTMDSKSDCFHTNIEYIRVAVNDNESAHIDPYFIGCCNFIEKHIKQGGSVLLHCQAGASRSASIVIAYLIKCHQLSLEEAFKLSKQRRILTSPNTGFWRQLKDFELNCLQQSHQSISNGASENNNETTLLISFDENWCRRSCADFNMDGGQNIAETITKHNEITQRKVLDAGLDYVLGRGILNSDVQWFKFICDHVEKSIPYLHDVMFVDTTGDFFDTWCCEFKRPKLRSLLIDLGADESSSLFMDTITE
jgi:hypothetical protein